MTHARSIQAIVHWVPPGIMAKVDRRTEPLGRLLVEVRSCTVCSADLPLGPRPVVQIGRRAKIVIVGQAPGTKVHESGVPWQDPSGDHLRQWLSVDDDVFYNRQCFALLPMGLCYPGKKGSGDAPPRPECAPLWHERLLGQVHGDALVIQQPLVRQASSSRAASRGGASSVSRLVHPLTTIGGPGPTLHRDRALRKCWPYPSRSHRRLHIRTQCPSPRGPRAM